MIEIWTDGAAEPTNPGPAAIGAYGARGEDIIFEISLQIGWATNNVAEYKAAIAALCVAQSHFRFDEKPEAVLRTDSRLVVEQFNGRWKCRSDHLKELLDLLRRVSSGMDVTMLWIPREENELADYLSKECLIGEA